MGMQVARWLRSWSQREPSRVSVVLDGPERETVTFGELDARASRVAAELRRRGVRVGDRVALLAANDLDFVATFYGALYAGAVVLPLPTSSAADEIRFRLSHSGTRLLVCDATHEPLARSVVAGSEVVLARGHGLAENDDALDGPCDLPAGATALLLYTSGTTATPKAACITHASLVSHTSACVHHVLRLDRHDVVLGALPLTHSYGLRMALLAPAFVGARTVLLRRFETDNVRRVLQEAGVTWFPGVPTMFSALARGTPAQAPSRLRWCLSAGAQLAPALRERAEAVLGVPVREGYGLTEATFTTIDSPDDQDGGGTVGLPVPGVEVAIVDEHGSRLPPGERGEIVVRGQNVMSGYFADEEATRAAVHDGWLHTGDIGDLDPSGRLRILDRKKDLIVRGGFNVMPAEVERALVAFPEVADALVVGVQDNHYGEEIVAVVVAREPGRLHRDALSDHLHRQLGSTKRPRWLAIVDALPIGGSGKALRRVLREALGRGELVLERLP